MLGGLLAGAASALLPAATAPALTAGAATAATPAASTMAASTVDGSALKSISNSSSVTKSLGLDTSNPASVHKIQGKILEGNPNGLPKFGQDGKWGPETSAAYEDMMANDNPLKSAYSDIPQDEKSQPEAGSETGMHTPVYTNNLGLRKQF